MDICEHLRTHEDKGKKIQFFKAERGILEWNIPVLAFVTKYGLNFFLQDELLLKCLSRIFLRDSIFFKFQKRLYNIHTESLIVSFV